MISRHALLDYLGREMQDYTWLKKAKRGQVLDFLSNVDSSISFYTMPFLHQLAGMAISTEEDTFLFFMDAGTGKTKLSLDILAYKALTRPAQTLVLVPNEQVMRGWERNIELHSDASYCSLYGTTEQRWDLWRENEDQELYICTYTAMQHMVCDLEPVKRRKKNEHKLRNKRVLTDRLYELTDRVDAVVFDEIHLCKNSESVNFKMCNIISHNVDIRYGLTGTPFGRNPVDLWAQFFLIDLGETLDSLGLFREALFKRRNSRYGPVFRLPKYNEPVLQRLLNNKSITYTDKECNDLPPSVNVISKYRMTKTQDSYYKEVLTRAVENHQTLDMMGTVEAKTKQRRAMQNTFVRLRQISSGFMVIDPKEEGEERLLIDLPENPKMELLTTHLDEFPESDKVVICCEFIHSLESIRIVLNKRKANFVELYGASKDKASWRRFQEDKNIRYMLMVTASGGVGIDLFAANRQIFYESPVGGIMRRQAEKRCHRTGQTKRTYIYDLTGSMVEEKVLSFVKQGKDLMKVLLGDPANAMKHLTKKA